ncbi:MAG: hypothetical protein ABJL71_18950 [Cyclobacteriaceae bacterium]
MDKVNIKLNKEHKVVLNLSHSHMEDFCHAVSYMVDMYCRITSDKSISKMFNQSDAMTLLQEAIFLELYNRLMKSANSPIRGTYIPADKYTVKLTKAEAVAFWVAVNPINTIQDNRPSLRFILDQIHKLLS